MCTESCSSFLCLLFQYRIEIHFVSIWKFTLEVFRLRITTFTNILRVYRKIFGTKMLHVLSLIIKFELHLGLGHLKVKLTFFKKKRLPSFVTIDLDFTIKKKHFFHLTARDFCHFSYVLDLNWS